jgi:hypothetical protein
MGMVMIVGVVMSVLMTMLMVMMAMGMGRMGLMAHGGPQ